MEIKIELKPISDKVFSDLESAMVNKIKLLKDEEKLVLKHKLMELKKQHDVLEFDYKNITKELNEYTDSPKGPVAPKPVELPKKEEKFSKVEPEEIEL